MNLSVCDITLVGLRHTLVGQVRLYNISGTIVSANLTTSDPIEGSPSQFYTQSITPTVLTPGTYYIAEDAPVGQIVEAGVSELMVNPAITFVNGVDSLDLDTNPTLDINGIGGNGIAYFGPDFDVEASSPEPGSLAIAGGMAVAGFAALRKRRLSRLP